MVGVVGVEPRNIYQNEITFAGIVRWKVGKRIMATVIGRCLPEDSCTRVFTTFYNNTRNGLAGRFNICSFVSVSITFVNITG